MSEKKTVRCAIYTRKSNEEGLDLEFNSLDAQRQAGESFVQSQKHEGWQCSRKRYDDGGFSGGTMDRPALQDLLADVQAGHIDCVVVYKVDRLSRSLLDFAKLVDLFDAHQVSFVSVTQQFNTTTSMGRLTLNILLSFAQFEREIIGERIRDKKLATAKLGRYIGGQPGLGYDIVDRRLVVNEEEANVVRRMYRLFLELQSVQRVADVLNAEAIRTKAYVNRKGRQWGGTQWDRKQVYALLVNRKYLGLLVHKGTAYPGEHPALIDNETFERVKKIMHENCQSKTKHKVHRFSLLRRMMRCGHCGGTIQPSWVHKNGRELRYYTCARKMRQGYKNCPLPTLPAGQIETAVVDQLRALLRHPDVIARTYREVRRATDAGPDPARLAKLDDLRSRKGTLQKSIRAVLNTGDQGDGFMADELNRLSSQLKALEQTIREIEATPEAAEPIDLNRVANALKAVDPVWEVLFPEEHRRILMLLIEGITVGMNGLDIRFRTNGIEQIVDDLAPERLNENKETTCPA